MVGEIVASPVIQLGALGLLAVFVVLSLRRDATRDKVANTIQESYRTQQAEDARYMRQLVDQSLAAQTTQMDAWGQMTHDTIAAHAKVADSYDGMTEALAANCEAITNGSGNSAKAHTALADSIQSTHAAIDDLRRALPG